MYIYIYIYLLLLLLLLVLDLGNAWVIIEAVLLIETITHIINIFIHLYIYIYILTRLKTYFKSNIIHMLSQNVPLPNKMISMNDIQTNA